MPGPDVDLGHPRARTVYAAAWRMFREHPGTVVGTAALVLVPFAVIDAVGLLHVEIDSSATTADIVTVALTLVASTLSGLASIFYAGMLDHASAAWHRGERVPHAREVATHLPWWRLVLASILWFVAVTVGMCSSWCRGWSHCCSSASPGRSSSVRTWGRGPRCAAARPSSGRGRAS